MPGTLQDRQTGLPKNVLRTHGSAIRRSVSFMIRFGSAMVNGQCAMRCSLLRYDSCFLGVAGRSELQRPRLVEADSDAFLLEERSNQEASSVSAE